MVWGWNKDVESQGLRDVVFISLGDCLWKLDLRKVITGENQKKKLESKHQTMQPTRTMKGPLGCEQAANVGNN